MITIRNEQKAALAAESRRNFEDRMKAQIAAGYPAKYVELGDAGTTAFIQRAIEIGARNKIFTEGGVAVLIELMIEFGEAFELTPDRKWARTMLAHPTLPEAARLDAIRDRLTARTQGRTIVRFDADSSS